MLHDRLGYEIQYSKETHIYITNSSIILPIDGYI
jgi:hypothetical protein